MKNFKKIYDYEIIDNLDSCLLGFEEILGKERFKTFITEIKCENYGNGHLLFYDNKTIENRYTNKVSDTFLSDLSDFMYEFYNEIDSFIDDDIIDIYITTDNFSVTNCCRITHSFFVRCRNNGRTALYSRK